MKKILLVAFIIIATFQTQAQKSKITSQFIVKGNCEMCEVRIEKAANSLKGVAKADWDLKSKVITVKFDSVKTNLDQIHKAISDMGYQTETLAANKNGYDALPFCCKVSGACEAPKKK